MGRALPAGSERRPDAHWNDGTNTTRPSGTSAHSASSVAPNASIRDGSDREPKSNFSSSPPAELLRTMGSSEVGGIT